MKTKMNKTNSLANYCGIVKEDITLFIEKVMQRYNEFKGLRTPSMLTENVEKTMCDNSLFLRVCCILAAITIKRITKGMKRAELEKYSNYLVSDEEIELYNHSRESYIEACCLTKEEIDDFTYRIAAHAKLKCLNSCEVIVFMEDIINNRVARRIIAFLATKEIMKINEKEKTNNDTI